MVTKYAKNPTHYRKERLKQIKQCVERNKDIDDIMFAGDLNQDVRSTEIQWFFNEIGLSDIHSRINKIEFENMSSANKNGSKPIDTIAATEGIIEHVDGCKLFSHAEVVISDHRPCVIDVNLEEYFNECFSSWDQIDSVKLNPSRRSHKDKFCEALEEQTDVHQLENKINHIAQCPTIEERECINKTITETLNTATKKVEGIIRKIPYSANKARVRDNILCWKAYVRHNRGGVVDIESMEKRKNMHQIEATREDTLEEAAASLAQALKEWEEVKQNGIKHRKEHLLDHHHTNIDEDTGMPAQKKKQIIKAIKRKLKRKSSFKHMSKHAGKGIKGSLKGFIS